MDQIRPTYESSTPSQNAITPTADWPVYPPRTPSGDGLCADPGQKQVPGKWITQKGIDSSRPVTEASYAKVKSIRVSHHRYAGTTRPSLRNGFNGFLRARPGDRALLSPWVTTLARCTGYQRRDIRPTRLRRPRITRLRQMASPGVSVARLATLPRPSLPALNVRDDAQRPSRKGGMNSFYCCVYLAVKSDFGKSEILSKCPATGSPIPAMPHATWLDRDRPKGRPSRVHTAACAKPQTCFPIAIGR